MPTCPYCQNEIVKPSVIWTDEGLAHYQCWYDKVSRVPTRSEPISFLSSHIYEQNYDAATGIKIHPKRVINRMNTRWSYTFGFDKAYKGLDS